MKTNTIHSIEFLSTMLKTSLLFYLPMLLASSVSGQNKTPWNNKKAAVSLTYDDALNVHLDNVVPALDSLGFKGTFYLTGYFTAVRERAAEWKPVADNGHELGNHTLFHPCSGSRPGRDWVSPEYDLDSYTVRRIAEEIKMTNILLTAIDGKTRRTLAYTCGDTKAGDSSYVDAIRQDFVAARGVNEKLEKATQVDLFDIGAFMINGQSGDELVELVKKAMRENAWLVFLFHGVGGEHSLNVSLDAHNKLLGFLKQQEEDIWVAPLLEVADYVKKEKEGS